MMYLPPLLATWATNSFHSMTGGCRKTAFWTYFHLSRPSLVLFTCTQNIQKLGSYKISLSALVKVQEKALWVIQNPASDSAIDLNNAISIICVNCGISVPLKTLNGYTFEVNRYSSRPMRMQYFLWFWKIKNILAAHWLRAGTHSSQNCIQLGLKRYSALQFSLV